MSHEVLTSRDLRLWRTDVRGGYRLLSTESVLGQMRDHRWSACDAAEIDVTRTFSPQGRASSRCDAHRRRCTPPTSLARQTSSVMPSARAYEVGDRAVVAPSDRFARSRGKTASRSSDRVFLGRRGARSPHRESAPLDSNDIPGRLQPRPHSAAGRFWDRGRAHDESMRRPLARVAARPTKWPPQRDGVVPITAVIMPDFRGGWAHKGLRDDAAAGQRRSRLLTSRKP